MVAPRRKFPGGSTGGFFALRMKRDNGDAEQFIGPGTEAEIMLKAKAWAEGAEERIYIAQYVNYVDPSNA